MRREAALRLPAALAAAALLIAGAPAGAQRALLGAPAGEQERLLKEVRLDQRLGESVPAGAAFRDEEGRPVILGDDLGRRPVALVLIQYRCTMLCSEQMNTLLASLRELRFTPGREFDLLIVSIDPREGPELAAEKKRHYLDAYSRPQASAGWHWLTGAKEDVDRVAEAIGYHYRYDARTDQYAHPDGVILVTPEGRIARYFFGLSYPARDLRLGMVEASSGRIGTPLDAIALLCFHYNPITGKYALAVLNLVRLGGIATVAGLAVGILLMRARDRARRRGEGALAG